MVLLGTVWGALALHGFLQKLLGIRELKISMKKIKSKLSVL
jgi:hypothetical protein